MMVASTIVPSHYRSLPLSFPPTIVPDGGESPEITPAPDRAGTAGGGSAEPCSRPAAGRSSAFPRTAAPTPPHRLRFVQQVLHSRVAQLIEYLHTVDSQHHRQVTGPASSTSLGVVGTDAPLQSLPGNQPFHPFQKLLPAGLALLVLQLQVGWSISLLLLWQPFVLSMP